MAFDSRSSFLITEGTREIVDTVVKQVRDAVVSTMGPNGKLAFIGAGVSTKTTKDGVTVAKSIRFNDPHHELVNRVLTEPAIKTDHECGDGTTTTIMLTAALYDVWKENPLFLDQKNIEAVILQIIEELKAAAIFVAVDDPRLYAMALTSSNQDEKLAKAVVDLYIADKGKYPEIELKDNQHNEDKIERVDGRILNMTYTNPSFGKDSSGGEFVLDRHAAVIVDNTLARLDSALLYKALDAYFEKAEENFQQAPLLLIARGMEQDTVSQLITYIKQGKTWVKEGVPRIIALSTNVGGSIGTTQMQDLAVMLDAPMINDIYDIANFAPVLKTTTVTLGGSRGKLTGLAEHDIQRIDSQAESVQNTIDRFTLSERFSVRAKWYEKRIRNLRGSLVTIHVGGETNSEIKERIDRYQDVVKAVKSALVNGILPGAGISLMEITAKVLKQKLLTLRDDQADAIFNAMRKPYTQLMAPVVGMEFINNLNWAEFIRPSAFNLATGQQGNPEDLGIFDTAFAAITALKGGLQTAKILANTQSLILGEKGFAVESPSR